MNLSIARAERVYANAGNPPVLALLEGVVQRVLDVGCGAGDNAAFLEQCYVKLSAPVARSASVLLKTVREYK